MNNNYKAGFIALIGRPNVGKSTLSNELLGQKVSITSHKAQTTRHQIQLVNTTDDYQMILVDTPGIHISNTKVINSYMNKTASSAIQEVDVILWLIEAGVFNREDKRVLEHLQKIDIPVIVCINKIDKLKNKEILIRFIRDMAFKYKANEYFSLSSFNKKNVIRLKSLIVKYLPYQQIIFDKNYLSLKSNKFIIAEFIREKLLRNLSQEIPYDLTVMVEKYEKIKDINHIYAVIFVNKQSQKNIIIGKEGQMLKQISTASRISLENFLHTKVFLKLWVKVENNWFNNKKLLSLFGYD